MAEKLKGLLVEVYRGKFESTNGGVSSFHDTLLLVGDGVPEIFEESYEHPTVKLMTRNVGGRVYKYVQPLMGENDKTWFMFGGNFVYTSDSRFPNTYPLSIHDRVEVY
jgi:hypothetical protein